MSWLHQHYEVLTIVTGIIAVVMAWFQFRKREQRGLGFSDSRLQHSPIVTGSHNQVILGNTPLIQPRSGAARPERLTPNLVYAGAKRKDIFVNPWPREGVCDACTEGERLNAIHALVLRIENRPMERQIARAMNVIAKVTFKHNDGATARDIDYGVWLNTPCNAIDIGIGDTRELILLYLDSGTFRAIEDRRAADRDFSSEPFSYVESHDIDGYVSADVAVIDQNSQMVLRFSLKFWRDGASICTSA